MNNQRNLILAVVLTALVLFGWDAAVRYFYPQAPTPSKTIAVPPAAKGSASKPTREGGLVDPDEMALEAKDLKTELAQPTRVPISAPGLSGSINTTGALVDDLTLNRHTATVEKNSGPARMFSPPGTPAQQYAQFGWVAGPGGGSVALPNASTQWTAPAGARLTPSTPLTLTWSNSTGQTFAINFAIDRDYMLTVSQSVLNHGTAPISVKPFAFISRTDRTASVNAWNVHSGPLGAFDGSVHFKPNYKDLDKDGIEQGVGHPDWLGFTDVYWMSALIPGKGAATSDFRALGNTLYRADVVYDPAQVAPGQEAGTTTRLFAGAKESAVLDRYENAGIPHFGLAIDWGWFRWFEKPIFWLLKSLFSLTGNFGVAIILLTVIVRGVMFPVAQRQFANMAAMRAIQPKMKALQERYKDDKQTLQQETMALYKKEGVNPLAGCLPMVLQVPVFFALYKTLILSIEMRHQPFVLWIKDLSAPDPLHVLNLFGLLPFTPTGFLGIGVLALLLGTTMYFQFKLNPAAADPVQQQVFSIMPWMMMFVMAPFAAGLLVYWITSNLLTIAQQSYLYSKHPHLRAQAAKTSADSRRAAARDKPVSTKPAGKR